ncbi:hypothetical protein HMPREF9946_03999 [Acetobacteraceae bacterium AT-5844]|nr:hypothetical protein HMPREF9946_03999 [Acetobacteraceae bacterium AT-5844]
MSGTIQSGTFAGMSRAQLTERRAKLQEALLALAEGQKAVSVAYTMGNGSRSVTFTPADEDRIRGLIRQINGALGLRRGAIGVSFR